jgi:hypothetical protein
MRRELGRKSHSPFLVYLFLWAIALRGIHESSLSFLQNSMINSYQKMVKSYILLLPQVADS